VGFSVREITCYHVGILRGDACVTQFSTENVRFSVNMRESILYSYRPSYYFVVRLAITTSVLRLKLWYAHVFLCVQLLK